MVQINLIKLIQLSLLVWTVRCHVEMTCPAPRKSQYNKAYGSVDYDMNSPLGTFPCKGYAAGPSVGSYKSGSNVAVTLSGSATHNGGHCQFSLSYDGGNTFVVIKTIMGNCLVGTHDYSVQIPESAPSSEKVVFAWSWINRTGNREYYMNCADISIQGTANGKITGPKMFVANLPGYPTIPEFTNGGYDGSDLYAKCETITVGGNGSTNTGSNGQNTPDQIKNSQSYVASQAAPSYTPVHQSYPVGKEQPSSNAVSSQAYDTGYAPPAAPTSGVYAVQSSNSAVQSQGYNTAYTPTAPSSNAFAVESSSAVIQSQGYDTAYAPAATPSNAYAVQISSAAVQTQAYNNVYAAAAPSSNAYVAQVPSVIAQPPDYDTGYPVSTTTSSAYIVPSTSTCIEDSQPADYNPNPAYPVASPSATYD